MSIPHEAVYLLNGCGGAETECDSLDVRSRLFGRAAVSPSDLLGLVNQNGIQKRAMNLDFSIVTDEAELAELIHEKANP